MTPRQKTDPATAQWHLDRRVNISTILTLWIFLLAQTAGGAYWAAAVSENVKKNRGDIDSNSREILELRSSQRITREDLTGRMIRVEEKLSQQTEILYDIRDAVRPAPNSR